MSLLDEVRRFKTWEAGVEWPVGWIRDYTDYPDWEQLYTSALSCFHSANDTWKKEDLSALIYAVDRDDEIENLSTEMAKSPELFLQFARAVLASNEANAKWQIAARLSSFSKQKLEAESLLTALGNDPDEYVRRRALLALGYLKSSLTEGAAEKAWTSGDEYQRIAVLIALKEVNSSKLERYLAEARIDGRKFLLEHVTRIDADRS